MEESKKKKLKAWQIVLIVLGGLFVLGIFSSLIGNNNSSLDDELDSFGNVNSHSNEKLTILNHEQTYSEYGNLVISGSAKNTAGRELSYCEVEVKFYDSDGAVIGNSLDNINDLGEDETWKFEVYYIGTDDYKVDSYKVVVDSCW